ncbi:hypothetical protein Tco_1302010 [Tanacetum coccineum]
MYGNNSGSNYENSSRNNLGNNNKVENIFETKNANNNGANNATTNVVGEENLPQLLNSMGGSYVTNVPQLDVEDFNSWKDKFLIYLDGLEHFLLEILENGPFIPKSTTSTPENFLPKPQNEWIAVDRRLANQDKRLKSIIISCLPNGTKKAVIKCSNAREIWNDLILSHEGPSKIRDTKVAALRLKFNDFKALEGEKASLGFEFASARITDFAGPALLRASDKRSTIISPSVPQEAPLMDPYNA